ncbi:sporulation stage III protein AG [Tissierella sp.]|uniref:sporulation stage III protein AG n=1 Tax=Tissierella sp. TaxID=41274 RepID=UPI00285E67FE|nr:sporulation stage III protein AG [Tissierella sp.]MDR7856144.1 sporulation stage III protein AG [Tissierella sp.]
MNEILEKIKKYLDKVNNKKFINNLLIILMVSIILLIVANNLMSSEKESDKENSGDYRIDYSYDTEKDYSSYLEKKLVDILEKFQGVSKVSVMITLENTEEKITANNTTKTTENTIEKDSEGGTRETIREDVNIQVLTKGNDEELMVIKEIKPKVQGVIVVATGVDDPEIKEMLYEAVKTVLGIKGNKVQVYSSK